MRFETFLVIVLTAMLVFAISCISPSASVNEIGPSDPSIPEGETPEYLTAFQNAQAEVESGNYAAAATRFAEAYEIARTDVEKEKCSVAVVANLLRIPGVSTNDPQIKQWLDKAQMHAAKSEELPELKVLKSFVDLSNGKLTTDISGVPIYSSNILSISAGELYAYQALVAFLSGDRTTAAEKLNSALSVEPTNPVVTKIAATLRSLGL